MKHTKKSKKNEDSFINYNMEACLKIKVRILVRYQEEGKLFVDISINGSADHRRDIMYL